MANQLVASSLSTSSIRVSLPGLVNTRFAIGIGITKRPAFIFTARASSPSPSVHPLHMHVEIARHDDVVDDVHRALRDAELRLRGLPAGDGLWGGEEGRVEALCAPSS